MLTILTSCLKGGVGKTTASIALAHAATDAGPVVLCDGDSQGSALRWAALAEEAGAPLPFTVTGLAAGDVATRLSEFSRAAACAVIDAPPGDVGFIRQAARFADVAIVPVLPRPADVDRLHATLAQIHGSGARVLAVLTMVRGGTSAPIAARQAIENLGVPVAATELPMRESIAAMYGSVPAGALATFGRELLFQVTEAS
jgi:chromosome partitioning protein